VLAAGGYLGRLCQAGLVSRKSQLDVTERLRYVGYALTSGGRAMLQAHGSQNEIPSAGRCQPKQKLRGKP